MFVVCFLANGLCDGLIIHSEESHRVCVSNVCNLKTWTVRRPGPSRAAWATEKEM